MSKGDSDEDGKPSRLKIITTLGYTVIAIVVGLTMTGIQANSAKINELEKEQDKAIADLRERIDSTEQRLESDLDELEVLLTAEIDRLDQSNRDRRNSIAELEVATSANLALVEELRRDVERLLPFGSDGP